MASKRVELLVERSTKHGQAGRETKSRTYLIWQSMIGRCHRPSDSSYRWYGAKGVTVCDRWRKFEDFFSDMGTAPDGMHIHRTSGSSVYSKETCVWMNESEHIGLHNTEQGWGARMTRAQLIDALTGAKAQLAAAKPKTTEYAQGWDDHVLAARSQIEDLQQQLAAERERYPKFAGELAERAEQQLAAEREAGQALTKLHRAAVDTCNEARKQLAAEKDRYERLWEISGQLSEEVAKLNVQLEAERELKEKAIESWGDRNLKLSQQLAAERRKVQTLTEQIQKEFSAKVK